MVGIWQDVLNVDIQSRISHQQCGISQRTQERKNDHLQPWKQDKHTLYPPLSMQKCFPRLRHLIGFLENQWKCVLVHFFSLQEFWIWKTLGAMLRIFYVKSMRSTAYSRIMSVFSSCCTINFNVFWYVSPIPNQLLSLRNVMLPVSVAVCCEKQPLFIVFVL